MSIISQARVCIKSAMGNARVEMVITIFYLLNMKIDILHLHTCMMSHFDQSIHLQTKFKHYKKQNPSYS